MVLHTFENILFHFSFGNYFEWKLQLLTVLNFTREAVESINTVASLTRVNIAVAKIVKKFNQCGLKSTHLTYHYILVS